jgi:hypothetical protein
MYRYAAYGLTVSSALPLPELMPDTAVHGAATGEIVIRSGPVSSRPTELDANGFGFRTDGVDACHVLDKVGAFLVRGGREIIVDAAPDAEDRVLRLSILGPALGLLLHQRGLLVLHGSVVASGGEAIAFLGMNGWGKSTIAAALHAKGYDLVADDVAAIAVEQEGGPFVLPGFPQVKLWPEAATLLGESPERLPLLHPSFDKRGWRAERGFSLEPRRLTAVYALAAGPSPTIERLGTQEGCFEVLAHWYGHRFGGGLLQNLSAAHHLRQSAALAASVPVHRLCRTGGSKALLQLADLVDEDLRDGDGTLMHHERSTDGNQSR